MTNISHDLDPSVLNQLYDQLHTSFGKLDAARTELFLSDLLGYEERVMLAKRLAAILLIAGGCSLYKVADRLSVSPTTAKTIKMKFDNGGYDRLLGVLVKQKSVVIEILETLDNILHLGGILPHYNGLDRYKYVR